MKCFHPDGVYVWDTWYYAADDGVHCTFLQQARREYPELRYLNGSLGHAISKDLIHWENRAPVLFPGEKGSHDDGELWTGCTVTERGVKYLYYTGNHFENGILRETVCLATSDDGEHYVKRKKPLFAPDEKYYVSAGNLPGVYRHGGKLVDCRDMCVVRDPDGNGWYGYFAARVSVENASRSSVIGLAYSHDLVNWEQRPPCFVPERYGCVEVPEVFFLEGKWYMLCLTGNLYGQRSNTGQPEWTSATIQAVAEKPEGPFTEIYGAEVLGSYRDEGFCAKTLLLDGHRYIFYTQGEAVCGSHFGSIALPSELKVSDGKVVPCWCAPLDLVVGEPVTTPESKFENTNRGQYGTAGHWEQSDGIITGFSDSDWSVAIFTDELDDCFMRCSVMTGDSSAAGLVFRASADGAPGAYVCLLDPVRGEIMLYTMRDFRLIARKKIDIRRDKYYDIRILVCGGVVTVYVDDVLQLQLFDVSFAKGRCGLLTENGTASFKNVTVSRTND